MPFCLITYQSGETPLHKAASKQNDEQVLQTLIKAGADLNFVDKVSYHSITTNYHSYNNGSYITI